MAANGSTLFAGTSNMGVWRRPLDEVAGIKRMDAGRTDQRDAVFDIHAAGQSRTILFSLSRAERVTVKIYNLSGREVASLVNSRLAAGFHRYAWNAGKYPAGYYAVQMRAGSRTFVRSVPIMR